MLQLMTLLLMGILVGAEVDLFIPSFPELQTQFNLTPFMVELSLGVNLIGQSLTSFFAGTLGDKYGRKPIILGGLAVFILGSWMCVFANFYGEIIVGRLLQGIGVSGPAVLSFLVIADMYSVEKQQKLMGALNGLITIAMAFAPVLGSYISFYFQWRGNFVALLLLGGLCFVLGWIFLPKGVHNKKISFSLKEYKHVLKSKKANYYTTLIVSFCISYWVFIALAPIYYMEGLHVSLKEFGFFQGSLAAIFSITSFTTGYFIKKFGQKNMVYAGLAFIILFLILYGVYFFFPLESPFSVTGLMLVLSIGLCYPINLLYPLALDSVPNAKGRISALITAGRLLMAALFVQIISYFYCGIFMPIGLGVVIAVLGGLYAGYKLWPFPLKDN